MFLVLEHDRRKVLHFNVTEYPTGAWTAQQIVEAFADRDAARYLLRDRDSRYSTEVRLRIKSLGMEEILTATQSPWQNPYAERLIGSIRRECLNHYVFLNARHLKRTLSSYFRYYHESRPHLAWVSNVRFLNRCWMLERLSPFHNSAASITGMNVQRHSTFLGLPHFVGSDSLSLQVKLTSTGELLENQDVAGFLLVFVQSATSQTKTGDKCLAMSKIGRNT